MRCETNSELRTPFVSFDIHPRSCAIVILMAFSASAFSQKTTVKGIVFDKDSITPMPFAYVVNKNSSEGTLSDEKGFFSTNINLGDTLSFSYLGYGITKLFTHLLKDSVKNGLLNVKVFLKPKASELKPIIISTHSFTKEEKEYYARKADEYNRGISWPLASPITAMYYAWSKKGKELQKLSVLYQQVLIDEVKAHRLSPEKIRALTGNDTLDVKEFMNFCYLPDQFVVSASDYDLFLAVNRYYKQYMEMHTGKK
ncbi:MAG: carboxypeptidase-like regulatory domain-containing protein [Bacteroidota bacterium]